MALLKEQATENRQKNCVIKSVSVTLSESDFLEEFSLSPTALLKEKIWEMKGMISKTVQSRIDKQASVIAYYSGEIDRLQRIIEDYEKDD